MAFKIFTYNNERQIVRIDDKGDISQLTPDNLQIQRGYQAPNEKFFAKECFTNFLQALNDDHLRSKEIRKEFHKEIISKHTHSTEDKIRLETLIQYKMFDEAFHFIENTSNGDRSSFAEEICYDMAKFIQKHFNTPHCTWKVYL